MSEIYSILEQVSEAEPVSSILDAKSASDDWLDHWLIAAGEPLKSFVATLSDQLTSYEASVAPRSRKRRGEDQRTFERMVELAVCNLASCVLRPGTKGSVAYKRATGNIKKTRYMDPLFSVRVLNRVVDGLEALGFAKSEKGAFDRKRSSCFAPTEAFRASLHHNSVRLENLGRSEEEELVFLTTSIRGRKEHGGKFSYGKTRHLIDYTDIDETRRCRAELYMLNKYCFGRADIGFNDDHQWPKVDTTAVRLKRFFFTDNAGEERFDLHGRLYGPWWIHLNKDRGANIRIQGEPPVDLDFSNMFGRLLYAMETETPPAGDLYDLEGVLDGFVLEEHRKAVKSVFNAMLFSEARRLPRGTTGLPFGTNIRKLKAALAEKHPAIAHHFGNRQIGFKLMMAESRIMLGILHDLFRSQIVVLPVHDGLMVARSNEAEARKAMRENAIHYTGHDIPVSKKGIKGLDDQEDTASKLLMVSPLDL